MTYQRKQMLFIHSAQHSFSNSRILSFIRFTVATFVVRHTFQPEEQVFLAGISRLFKFEFHLSTFN